jgi:hypothetical protein
VNKIKQLNPNSEVIGGGKANEADGVRPSSGAATALFQTTEHFSTACLSHFAAAGTAALRQHRNSTSEGGFKDYANIFRNASAI